MAQIDRLEEQKITHQSVFFQIMVKAKINFFLNGF